MAYSNSTQAVTTGDFVDDSGSDALQPTAVADALIGVTLNETYRVERVLGVGGMGRVYLARHMRIEQKRVAIKVLHEEYAKNEEVLARFQREAEAAASVSHPNVMSVLDVDRTANGLPYLVCEYLEGVDLSERLRQVGGKLDTASALDLGRQLCQGLAAAHARGVIHRDLKPPNIFLLFEGNALPPRPEVKLLDFGLSRFMDTELNAQLTKSGYIMGTPAYMAPEQARGLPLDQRVDVYGVGAVLYTVLTGRPPFEAESPQATVLAVLNSESPKPRSIEPSISLELEQVLECALARDPAERYPDVLALQRALEQLELRPHGNRLLSVSDEDYANRPTVAEGYESRVPLAAVEPAPGARRSLALTLSAAVLLWICAALTAVTGLELANGYGFNYLELRVLLLAVLGISLTPTLLWFSRIRSEVWPSDARVNALLGSVRTAVTAAIASYGLGMLGLRWFDGFVVRAVANRNLQPLAADWPGWDLVLCLLAIVAAISALIRRRLAIGFGWGRSLATAILWCASLAAAGSILYQGWRWQIRLHQTPKVTLQQAPSSPSDALDRVRS